MHLVLYFALPSGNNRPS